MRKIKFRAWSALDKKMIYQDQENFSIRLRTKKEGNEIYIERSQFIDNFYAPDQGDLMQFTGLNDRNGREAWESDLYSWGAYPGGIVYMVVFDNGSFCLENVKTGTKEPMYNFNQRTWRNLHYLGNRFENPELVGRVG